MYAARYAQVDTLAGNGLELNVIAAVVIGGTSTLGGVGGVLGTLISGAGYVPLNPKFPLPRTAHMLNTSEAPTLIVGAECLEILDGMLALAEHDLTILLPTLDYASALAARWPRRTQRRLPPDEQPGDDGDEAEAVQ